MPLWDNFLPYQEEEERAIPPLPSGGITPQIAPPPVENIISTSGPPSSYEQWRDPYGYIEPETTISTDPDTGKTSVETARPTLQAYQPSATTQAYRYEDMPNRVKPFQPIEIRTPEYSTPELADWRRAQPIERVSLPQLDRAKQREDESVAMMMPRDEGGGIVYDPRYGWVSAGAQRPRMVMPGMGQPVQYIRIQARPGSW